MERLHCEMRAKRAGDESALFFLAEEALHPLAVGAGRADLYHPDELIGLLERAIVFVAEAGGEVAGFVAVERDDDALVVRCLCVGPAHEGRAVDDQLVEWAEGFAFNERLHRVAALIPAEDHPSRHLYHGHQFVPHRTEDRPDMIVMEKRLATD